MLLKLKNVGRLKSAEVKINGLTVICGNNNTGKSTVGKILYCIYDSLHDLEKNIHTDKTESITRSLIYSLRPYEKGYQHILGEISECISETIDKGMTGEVIIDVFRKFYGSDFDAHELLKRVNAILETSINDMAGSFITRRVYAEFGQELGNVNHPRRKVTIELDIKNDTIRFSSGKKGDNLTAEKFFSLRKNIIYMDDPFLIDDINSRRYFGQDNERYGHRNRMLAMLEAGRYVTGQTSAEEIIAASRLEGIMSRINSVFDGELVLEGKKFAYKHSKLKRSLSLNSVSTGIKTFIIIKKFLLDGILEENGIMVLDEPEVHLNPEWQIKLAEIIVLLQKAYGLNIVLTTHSMDFLSAVDYFSQKNGLDNVCSYYLTELEPSNGDDFPCAIMREMTDDKEKVYASISEPFLSLYKEMDS